MNKLYENEKLFAEANNSVVKASAQLAPHDFPQDLVLELYCECANKACFERFKIVYEEYKTDFKENIFFVKPNHYLPEFEKVLKKSPHYWTLQKRPDKLNKDFVT